MRVDHEYPAAWLRRGRFLFKATAANGIAGIMQDIGSLSKEEKLAAFKLSVVQYVIVGVMVVLLSGLWRLQILGGKDYRALAEQNRIRKVPILAPRGKLFDREGRLIVDNYPSVSCFLVREQGHDYTQDLPLIARGLHMTVDQLNAILKHYRTAPSFNPSRSSRTSLPTKWSFSKPIKTSFPNSKRWTKSADSILAMASPLT